MTNLVQFPGLGLEFTVDRVAFSIGSFSVYWYGILLATGLLCGLLFAFRYAADFGIDTDRMIDVVIIGTVMAVVCARAYYVAFAPFQYSSLWEIIDLRNGGIAIYGSVIGAFLFGGLACRWRKIPLLPMFDLTAMGFLIGQCIGRWGNFVNQEAFGTNTTLPWGMYSEGTRTYLASMQEALAAQGVAVDPSMPVHPTFLYESVWCLVGFLGLLFYMKKRHYNGEIAILYAIWYGLGRFWIEALRTDALMLSTSLNLRTSQVLALAAVLAGLAAEAILLRRYKGQKLTTRIAVASANLKATENIGDDWAELYASDSHERFVKVTAQWNAMLKQQLAENADAAQEQPSGPEEENAEEAESAENADAADEQPQEQNPDEP